MTLQTVFGVKLLNVSECEKHMKTLFDVDTKNVNDQFKRFADEKATRVINNHLQLVDTYATVPSTLLFLL